MTNEIQITKDFPPSRERAVLLELLAVTQALQKEGIDAVVCGGWVPFLKELAHDSQSGHSMSFDIDVLLRSKARERESVDRIKALLSKALAYEADKNASFRYQKTIEGNPIQLDLLADVARIKKDEAILKIQGVTTSLDVCCVDGGEDLNDHVETLTINVRDGDNVETFDITVPNAVGFLLLKTTVGHYREDSKDAYDIYYYCRYSEDATSIREMLAKALAEPAIARTVQDLKAKFTDTDSRWVEMILDEMSLHDEERDREAQFVVRTMKRVVENL
jgi:Nucleotidyl transferase AbiEii toxin, Type IV TA system